MKRSTVVVDGPLALRMRRFAAATRSEVGVQILTLPLLAARLAGGFRRPAGAEDLEPAIRTALDAGGFVDLNSMRLLPGMTRAVARTLAQVWEADLSLGELAAAGKSRRLFDLALIEQRVCEALPEGVLALRDLRNAAMGRIAHAPAVLGAIELAGPLNVALVWQSLLRALADFTELNWRDPGFSNCSWFPGQITEAAVPAEPVVDIVSCADPHTEVIESLRWVRELLATGRARPEEIAISAASTEAWDAHFFALAGVAELPVHFSHGIPALYSREGQACAALADVLINGLSQERVRRLLSHSDRRRYPLSGLSQAWAFGLKREAALFEVDQWRQALDRAAASRGDTADSGAILMTVIEILAKGTAVAAEAGELFLRTSAMSLWIEALRRAPPEALEFSLRELRLPDGGDPASSVVWCPAHHLVGAPRPWVRLLGLTSGSWPRRTRENPLLPDHILSRHTLDPDPVTSRDRRAFKIVTERASARCVLSRSRRSTEGRVLLPSPLLPESKPTAMLKRRRIPPHAFSESDRLLARPHDAVANTVVASAMECWNDWRKPTLTAHDGLTRSDHPLIIRAITKIQSATSLRMMLRDPIAFVWRYALGWHSYVDDEQPLSLDARAFGELVHELLKRTVDRLEPSPGYSRAARSEIEEALTYAVATITMQWPLERTTPPLLLWQHILQAGVKLALKALTLDEGFQPGTRSWTELAFGQTNCDELSTELPWNPRTEVQIPGTSIRISGRIDRLDLNSAGDAVRVSDYKTGIEPKGADQIVLGGGVELQRVIYAIAASRLVPETVRIVARLVFLGEEKPNAYKLSNVADAIEQIGSYINSASELLGQGLSLPGPDAKEQFNDFRIALPASASAYFLRKRSAFDRAFRGFGRVWRCR